MWDITSDLPLTSYLSLPPPPSPSPLHPPTSIPLAQSRMLVLEHGLLRIIVSTLLDILQPCKDPITGVLKLRSSNYKHSRVFYIMYDLRYEISLLSSIGHAI